MKLLTVEIRAEHHVVLARQRSRRLAALLRFDSREQTRLATAVSEIARNALQYAGGGKVVFSLSEHPAMLEVTIRDTGGGISDLAVVLEGRYVSRTGMGVGISGSRALVERFRIASNPSDGTTVVLGKPLPAGVIVEPELIAEIAAALAHCGRDGPLEEIQQQNQELFSALAELRQRQSEIEKLNSELSAANLALDEKARVLESHAELLRVLNGQLESANTRLREQREQLQSADRAKNQFLAVLGHELRNPLSALNNALYLLERPGITGKAAAAHRGVARRQSGLLTHLVEDLLDVARISEGKIALRRERISLADVLNAAVEGSRSAVEARRHRLDYRSPPPVWIDGDSTRLTQVFANLLTNAAKFTAEGGNLCLESEAHPGGEESVEVRVRDNGVGIPPEMLESIFQMFSQAPQTLDRSQGGLGIGLSLVRSLVEMHGGTVSARSEGRGRGTEFSVTLPISGAPQAGDKAAAPTPAVADSHLRVLVVEDNREAGDTLAEILEGWGHSVRVARNGAEALLAAREEVPDWVLCDIGLPGIDGYGVAAALRVMPETARVRLVALTGYSQSEDLARSREAGFDHHVVKPFAPETLQELLSSGLA